MDIHEKIEELYKKMNYEYTQELIQHNLNQLFSLYDDDWLQEVYEKQVELYEKNKAHYDNKPFIYWKL